jgi:hypothetical protein
MNNTMVREIHGAKINPKSSIKNWGAQNTQGRKYGNCSRAENLRIVSNEAVRF